MLPEERRAEIQERTDRFLGKPSLHTAFTHPSPDTATEPMSQLPPAIETPAVRPTGRDPFAHQWDNRTQQYTGTCSSSALTPPGCQTLVDTRPQLEDHPLTPSGTSRPTRHTSAMNPPNTTPSSSRLSVATESTVCHSSCAPVQSSEDEHSLIPLRASARQSPDRANVSAYSSDPSRYNSGPAGFTGRVLQDKLQSILDWTSPPTQKPEFSFRWTDLAARKNYEILQLYDMDIEAALSAQPFSALTVGSEFRPVPVLEPLLYFHPLWNRVKQWLTFGVQYPLRPIPDEDRTIDLQANDARGNHKSALAHDERITKMLKEEVERGWQLILPREALPMIRGGVLAPLGIVEQDTINEFGEIVPKWRLTHDMSFNVIPTTSRSVNNRVIIEELTPCRYGTALLRHIHYIVHLRLRHPTSRLLQSKCDCKAAYKRLHFDPRMIVQAIVGIGNYILLALRMTFGGAPNPSQWSDVSEMATDLANDLVRDDGWDHHLHKSPHQGIIGDAIVWEPEDIPIAPAEEIAVKLPHDDSPKADCYIDDIFSVFLEEDVERGSRIVPFVLHLLGRPIQDKESLTREDLLSMSKFIAEATPAERLKILGWLLDTRRLQIELPEDKYKAWIQTIEDLLQKDRVTYKELEQLLGRLNHAGFIIPLSRHFLGRLREAQYAAAHRRYIKFTPSQKADLNLWKKFLYQAYCGISLNRLTYRPPSHIERSDACEHGIGGFSATTGIAWRWEIPLELRWRTSLNVLEYLAGNVSIWMDINIGDAPTGSCFLSQTDSTSAAGWIRKSNFGDVDPMHLIVAQDTATMLMEHDSTVYSQWFQGVLNEIADSLSRDHHLSDSELLILLHSCVPEQIPNNFRICPLPQDVVSKITTWLLSLPPSTQSPTAPPRSKLATGDIGTRTSRPSNWTTIHSSLPSHEPNNTDSSPDSPPPSEPMTSNPTPVHQQLLHQYLAQSEPPSTRWHRPTGLTTDLVLSMTPTENLRSFYSEF